MCALTKTPPLPWPPPPSSAPTISGLEKCPAVEKRREECDKKREIRQSLRWSHPLCRPRNKSFVNSRGLAPRPAFSRWTKSTQRCACSCAHVKNASWSDRDKNSHTQAEEESSSLILRKILKGDTTLSQQSTVIRRAKLMSD